MTDREKLIKLIKEGECGALGREDCSYCKYDGEDDCSYQLLADILLTNGVVVREWIPVTERLPEDGVRVLAAHDDGVVRIGISRGYFPAVVAKNHTKAFGIAEVTHWMPLPEPPKEGE